MQLKNSVKTEKHEDAVVCCFYVLSSIAKNLLNLFSTVIATNLLLVDEMLRAGMSSLKG